MEIEEVLGWVGIAIMAIDRFSLWETANPEALFCFGIGLALPHWIKITIPMFARKRTQ